MCSPLSTPASRRISRSRLANASRRLPGLSDPAADLWRARFSEGPDLEIARILAERRWRIEACAGQEDEGSQQRRAGLADR